jgi:hypothetical protein
MAGILEFILGNFTLTFLVIGLMASGISLVRAPKPLTRQIVIEALFAYFLLFSIGFSLFYNFILHSFFGEMTAGFIGWSNSPFQTEIGFASLGYSVVGFLAFRKNWGLRIAAVIGPGLFLFCAGMGHVYQIILTHNFAPGNSGVILYMDFLIPCFGVALLWLQYLAERKARS